MKSPVGFLRRSVFIECTQATHKASLIHLKMLTFIIWVYREYSRFYRMFQSDHVLSCFLSVCSPSGVVRVPAILQCHSRQPGVSHLYLHHFWISRPSGHMAQVPSTSLIPRVGLWHTAQRSIEQENILLWNPVGHPRWRMAVNTKGHKYFTPNHDP